MRVSELFASEFSPEEIVFGLEMGFFQLVVPRHANMDHNLDPRRPREIVLCDDCPTITEDIDVPDHHAVTYHGPLGTLWPGEIIATFEAD